MNTVENEGPFLDAPVNTLRAGRWEMFLVSVFGRRVTGKNGRYVLKMARWKDKLYLLDFDEIGERVE